jgi:hypothetical protein
LVCACELAGAMKRKTQQNEHVANYLFKNKYLKAPPTTPAREV